MAVVAITLLSLWILSLWLLLVVQRRRGSVVLFAPLALTSGTLFFFVLSVASLLLLRLLFGA